jgi:hypothetical protein
MGSLRRWARQPAMVAVLCHHGRPAVTARALLDNRGHPDTVKDCRSEAYGHKLRGYPEGVLEPFRLALAWWS